MLQILGLSSFLVVFGILIFWLSWWVGGKRVMFKILGVVLLMPMSGIVCMGVTIIILMRLGLQQYDNYEYYGQYPVLFFGSGVIGFLLPLGVICWRAGVNRKVRAADAEDSA